MDFVDACPIIVVERIQGADLASSDNGTLFSWIASQSDLNCQVLAVEGVAARLNARSHLQVIGDFCTSVATYAPFFHPEALLAIKAAYQRFPYSPVIATSYFSGLRLTGIDLRDHLRGKVAEDWSFPQPGINSATWDYYLYLASLGEPGALVALADKIAATKNGNDATNLLVSLAEVKGKGVDDILRLYENDSRTADGTEGPGLKISENITFLRMMRAAAP